jgi:hypothetical protein
MILLVTLVFVYVSIVAVIGIATLSEANMAIQFVYYAIAGLLWVLPAMGIVKWMHKAPRESGEV